MSIIIELGLLVLGFFMLVKGADWFVEGASGIAEKFGIPQLIIGLTIVAMGTSLPEAAVSITAAMKGSAEITIGNVVGSNILNVLVILGLTSAITTLAVARSTIRVEIPFMILITVVLVAFGATGGVISFIEGVVLWLLFIAYLTYLFKMAIDNKTQDEKGEEEPLWKLIFGVIVGIILVVWGSDISVEAASALARMFGMSERLIGLTIVALGTSLPELVTSVSAGLKGKADIAIGNIVGSNIFNILFVVGTTALITPVTFASNFILDTTICAAIGILLLLCIFRKKELSRPAGILMLLCYAAYSIYLF